MTGIAVGAAFLCATAFGATVAVALACVIGAWQLALRRRISLPALGAVALAIGLGAWRREPDTERHTPPALMSATTVSGHVVSVPRRSGSGQSFTLAVDSAGRNGEAQAVDARVVVSAPLTPHVGYGDQVRLSGYVEPGEEQSASAAGYLWSQGAVANVFAVRADVISRGTGWRGSASRVSDRLNRVLTRGWPGDTGALLSGLVTGDDAALSPAAKRAFRVTGTSHLTAVSGGNLALLLTVASTAGTAAGVRRRLGWQLATTLFITGYAVLTGLHPPVVRAVLVAVGALFASRFGRKPDIVTLLVLSAAVMVAWDPRVIWSLSFQLSFAASFGLALALAERGSQTWRQRGTTFLIAIVAAQVATIPILISSFGTFSLLSVPANIVAAPLVAVAFPLALLAACAGLVVPALGEAVATTAGIPAWTLLHATLFLARGPAQLDLQLGARGTGLALLGCLAVVGWLSGDVSRGASGWLREASAQRGAAGVVAAAAVVSAVITALAIAMAG